MKRLLTVCFAMLITVSIMLTGCGTTIVERELSCYRGEEEKPDGSILYNTALFYDNEVQQGFPDPQVLDDTARRLQAALNLHYRIKFPLILYHGLLRYTKAIGCQIAADLLQIRLRG